jgi:hypothetical protein
MPSSIGGIKMKRPHLFLAAATLLAVITFTDYAVPSTLTHYDRGWYNNKGEHDPLNDNYTVGQWTDFSPSSEWHNWFVFDLSLITDPIVGATLRVFNPETGYFSPDAFETWTLFDVSTPISTLMDGTGGLSAFGDLAIGTIYGSVDVSNTDVNVFIEVTLNSDAISAINNAAGNLFALGGAVTTIGHLGVDREQLMGGSQGSLASELVLQPIPIPPTFWLLASSLIGLLSILRLKKTAR